MKRLITFLTLATLLVAVQADAQVPRTVLAEMASATW